MIVKNTAEENLNKTPNLKMYLQKFKGPIFAYIFASIIYSIIGIFKTIVAADMIVKVTNGQFLSAIYALVALIVLSVLERLLWWLTAWIYDKYSNKLMAMLNLDLAKQAFKLNSMSYETHDTGTFVQRIVNDPIQIVDNLASIVDYVANIISVLVIAIYITCLNGWIGLALCIITIISLFIEIRRIKTRKKNRQNLRREEEKITSLTTEIVRSEKDIKSLGLESRLNSISQQNYNRCGRARYKFYMTNTNLMHIRGFIIDLGVMLTLCLGILLIDRGLLTLATFIIIYSNRNSIFDLVYDIANIGNFFVDIKVSKQRMFSLFDEKNFVTEKFGNKKVDKVVGKIEFKNVSFAFKDYETPKENDEKEKNTTKINVLKNLSFKIKPHSTVAFVGRSGSGKSTIINLISKMYEADSGQVLIDDINIKRFDKPSLRNAISLVNQFPYIFDMTIKENLILAKENATDDEVIDALKKASLYDFVKTLPNGIDTKVGEMGIKLSGGQKQRLAIARALLRNSSIIIFDESTSSLDNFAQEEIKHTINELKGKSTIIIVAHRLSTIKDADVIFFLENGKILDQGTFEELFERNEIFKTMFLTENISND